LLQNRTFLFVANSIKKVRGTYQPSLVNSKNFLVQNKQPEDAPQEETQPEPLDEEQEQVTIA
jgi:hypothetical protein